MSSDALPTCQSSLQVDRLPDGWRRVRLGEVFNERKEKGRIGLPIASVSIEHGLVLRSSLDRRVVSDLPPEGHALVRKGDIAYNMMRMWQGACGLAEADCIISPAYVVMTPSADVDPQFAQIALRSEPMMTLLHGYSQGIVDDRLRLYSDAFAQVPINLPPLDEQRRIAEVLRSVDETIAAADLTSETAWHVFASVRTELLEGARATCDEVVVADAIAKNRGQKVTKLQTSDYLDNGAFPIIDQGASFICGFTNDVTALWPYSLPVIVFGDHTRVVKFVDFPFVIGADGTQCITPAAGFDARYLYYALQSLDLRGEGYARHFKLLKEKSIPMPTLVEQAEIAEHLASLEDTVDKAETATKHLRKIKLALISDLIFGRVRVPT